MIGTSVLLALKKIIGGILSIVLIAGIKKSKAAAGIDSIKKHIQMEHQRNPLQASQLYGNDIDAYIDANYPDKESFIDLMIVNAFRPLFVLILISVFDLQNAIVFILQIALVALLFPLETHYGEKWKSEKWYIFIIIFLWLCAFAVIAYSTWTTLPVPLPAERPISMQHS